MLLQFQPHITTTFDIFIGFVYKWVTNPQTNAHLISRKHTAIVAQPSSLMELVELALYQGVS